MPITIARREIILRNCFEFLQKVFLGLMYSFSCVLWAIFWSFPLLIFLITQTEMPQKLIPNQRTINSKQFLKAAPSNRGDCCNQTRNFRTYCIPLPKLLKTLYEQKISTAFVSIILQDTDI